MVRLPPGRQPLPHPQGRLLKGCTQPLYSQAGRVEFVAFLYNLKATQFPAEQLENQL
jgi:hypothetical protein